MIPPKPKSRQQIRQNIRTEKKFKKNIKKSEAQAAIKIKGLLKRIFSEEVLKNLALKSKFLLRTRKLKPFAIVAILLMGCLNGTEDVSSLETMCCFLREWFNIIMTPQALQEKINSKKCADFIKEVTTKVMLHETNAAIAKLIKKRNKSKLFRRILLQDSTVISLPATISKIFRGCGGSASKAAVKCDFIIDQSSHLIVRCKCISGRIPDSSLSEDILHFSNENDLVIRDMGYFNLSHFTKMNKKNVKFISRLKQSVYIYINKSDKEPINILEYLKSLNKKKIDIEVYVGKEERIHLRLIGVKVPKEVVDARRDQYIKSHCRKTTPSEILLEWYGYTLMITNLSEKDISLKIIIKLYKIRWQIELFFKNMKSQLKVDNFTGENKYRIICLLYSKLALTWITALLFALAQNLSEKKHIVSPVKFTKWLRDLNYFSKAVGEGDFDGLVEAYKRDEDLLRKSIKKVKMKKQPRIYT